MTWAELEKWVERNRFGVQILQTSSGRELYQGYLCGKTWQIVGYCWCRTREDAQDALCRAVERIREAR